MSKNVSNEFKEVIKNGGPFYAYAEVLLSDGTNLTLDSEKDFYIDGNNYSEDSGGGFPLGVAMSKTIDIGIDNSDDRFSPYDFYYAKITLYTEADLSSGTTERIKEGTFTVIDPVANGELIELTAYDDMYKADTIYIPGVSFPTSALSVFLDVCGKAGLNIGSSSFKNSDFKIESVPEDLTCRQVLGYLSMIAVGNAMMDENNRLIIKSYDFSVFETLPIISGENIGDKTEDSVYAGTFGDKLADYITGKRFDEFLNLHILSDFSTNPDISTDDVVITGIRMEIEGENSEKKTIVFGTEDYALTVENPLSVGKENELIDLLGNALVGVIARPFSGSFFPDPSIQFMDFVYLIDTKNNVYQSFITSNTFNYLGDSSLSNDLESPIRNKSQHYSQITEVYRKAREEAKKQKSEWEKAMEELSQRLDNSSGLYMTSEQQEDGSYIYYLHNKPTLAESLIVWKMTAEAVAVSTDGGKTWNAGLSVNGTLIAKIMSTIGINFDWGIGGTLILRDQDGNETVYMDAETGTVRMNVDSLSVKGKSFEEIENTANEALEEARNSKLLLLALDNEYQGIPTDAEGNYIVFPECKTKATVFFGSSDVSKNAVYSIKKSESITGNWDVETRTYTITGLSNDSGWVDITASYLSGGLKDTKRFSIAKQKQGQTGEQGKPGRTYFLQPSTLVIKKGQDDKLTPQYVSFYSYYRDGDSEERVSFKGIFIIRIQLESGEWEKAYQSAAPEIGINYTPNPNIQQIECKLLTEDSVILDSQTVAVLRDTKNLTQKELFNILTNNGEVEGIFFENGQLFVNGSYIRVDDLSSIRAKLSGFTMENDMLYSKLSTGYTVIKPFGDVAMAFGSPSYSDTSGAKAQIWHNGLITCARVRFTAEQGTGSFQRAISIETPYTGVWWGNSGRQKREVEWINGYSDSEIVLLLHDNIKGYICSYNDSNEFTFHIPLTAAAGFTNGSTRDLKTNINECEPSSCLEIIKSAKVKTYYYKNDVADGKAKEKYGFVIDEDCPEEFVSYNRKGVDIYSIASICSGAVKKLSEEVEELKKENQTLKENYSLLIEDMVKIKETLGMKNE